MREDFQETLDKMFPDGWAIAYTCPDKQIRWAHFNPHNAEAICLLYEKALEINLENES